MNIKKEEKLAKLHDDELADKMDNDLQLFSERLNLLVLLTSMTIRVRCAI